MKSSTCIDLESDNTCPKSHSRLAGIKPGIKAQLNCTQLSTPKYEPGRSDRIRPCGPGTGHGQASAVQPLSTPSSQAEKKTFQSESTFLSNKCLGTRITNKLYPNPARTFFFFGHESGKNVNLLRSWLVSFCDNCLSSLKPPTRCTSSLTEME